ncbi:MAG: hypothetical protein WC823_04995 [Parcubacteria group bacterium]|jgi:hypothetical protein
MKKSALRGMPSDSANYVVAHGIIQKSKRKNFSVSFRGIRNPRKAFEAAVAEILARKLLNVDAFSVAEMLTNRSYKNHSATAHLGRILHLLKGVVIGTTLKKMDDTVFSNKLSNYLRIIQEEGFQILLTLPFSDKEGCEEKYYICFHKEDGILLSFDTYGGDSINGGHFYYNWQPSNNDPKNGYKVLSSGGYRKDGAEFIWAGHHDCRETLRLHIYDLRKNGKFVTPWIEQPFIWLLHYMDTKNPSYDYKAINKERLAMLPPEVLQSITATRAI